MIKEYKGQIYYSKKAKNGSMVDVGEITCVYYLEHEGCCDKGTYKFYATDGWKWEHLGRFHPSALRAVGERNLNKTFDESTEFNTWLKNKK